NGSNMPAFFSSLQPTPQQLASLADAEMAKLKGSENPEDQKEYERALALENDLKRIPVSDAELTRLKTSLKDVPPDALAAVQRKVAAIRIWDLQNFVQILPYPGMRKKFDTPID